MSDEKPRVTGIGGVFFKAEDPEALRAWYAKHLGIGPYDYGSFAFKWRDEGGCTVWSPFSEDNDYFEPTNARFMINYRVEDLHAVLEALRSEGVEVDEKTEDSEFGKFGWARDCEGNRFELWQPPEGG